ncbi:hypothetical protein PENVUL_c020G06264 [Penicillium vulpinum]|uniref:Aminoglycoside phosphotransferase domain-containing protein n=1 Tax=Penicillium vulpinum TaxID=29845 RepID=A0A1V6RWL1_9EURO|nr:hypothetical protein PENVUL_c020G06264 [Penicillium vulpinum]
MRLVAKQTDVPVPEVLFTRFSPDEGIITPEEFFKPDYPLGSDLKLRKIIRPQELEGPYQCAADGSLSLDRMLEDLQQPGRPISSDSDLGLESTSDISTMGEVDIAPRNIIVDEQNNVTGILDWEYAGWYPEYWEYAQIMRPAFWGDWSVWMDKTAPQRWDLARINDARKVFVLRQKIFLKNILRKGSY